jgi:peptidoglycan glycosyltransferase
MNAPLRRAGVVVLVLFALLFANLNWVQAYKADEYRNSDYNSRVQISEYQRQRGSIEAGGGVVLAQSSQTDDDLKYQRNYPLGAQYGHIVGYKPVNLASTGIEKLENAYLQGTADSQIADRWLAMLTGKRTSGGNILLTLNPTAQKTAYDALRNKGNVRKGAVVALDPRTGALLAAVSSPSFDPNPLVSHQTRAANDAARQLDADPDTPLLNRGFSQLYPPGSTFKVIMSAAALASGVQPETVLQGGTSYTAPGTTLPIRNAPGVVCADQITLKQALTVSCNTAFAHLGAEQLGPDKIKETAKAFGFEETPHFDQDPKNIMGLVASHTGTMLDSKSGQVDKPAVAQSSIGQSNVQMTPLQGAMIAAAIANGGSQMRPYLIDKELAADRTSTYVARPQEERHPIDDQTAATMRDMMINVVQVGTGTSAKISGVQVGGKTGTAQNGDNPDHGWFIGFAIKDGKPLAAVAVFLERAGSGGSHDAAQIAGNVMQAIIGNGA